jgi:hypothetical protein
MRAVAQQLAKHVRELLGQSWQPLILPAAKAPEEAYRVFNDPSETVYSLLLARPFLEPELQRDTDACLERLIRSGLPRVYPAKVGVSRVPYAVPGSMMRVVDDGVRDDLARLYPLWLWSTTPAGSQWLHHAWPQLRDRPSVPASKVEDDCGNSRLAGLIAYCRLAKAAGDIHALEAALPEVRQSMRKRIAYELAHTRGGLIRVIPNQRSVLARWRRLTPEVAKLLAEYALPIQRHLMQVYVDRHRPAWWLSWNVEQLMRNEAPFQLPTTPLEIFTAKALVIEEPAATLRAWLDLPWCHADEFYLQKLALTLWRAAAAE